MPSPLADCSVRRTIGGFIGSRQNMLSVISGVVDVVGWISGVVDVVGCDGGVAVFRGGMMGVFSFR